MDKYRKLVNVSLKEYYPQSISTIEGFSWDVFVCESLHGKLLYKVYPPYTHPHGYEYDYVRLWVKDFCSSIHLSDEDTMLWVLKYGEFLPHKYSDLNLSTDTQK